MGIGKVLACILGLYLSAVAVLYVFQRSFIYFPADNSIYVAPSQAEAHKNLRELSVVTEDGLSLKGWYAPATAKRLTVVFFHGNGDSLKTAAKIAGPYLEAGFGFLLVEYRGYSGLPGTPTETGFYADGRAFLKALVRLGVNQNDVVLFGHSLGTGVATQMATEFNPAGLILLSPFLSVAKIAQSRFPLIPASLLTLDRYENFRKIGKIHTPLLVGHGGNDAVVPVADGQRLYQLANEPKEFHLFPDGQHSNLPTIGFTPVSLSWLERLNAAHHKLQDL